MSPPPEADAPPPSWWVRLVDWVTGHAEFVKAVLTIIQIAAVVVAAGWVLLEYRAKIQNDKIERSLAYIDESRSGTISKTRYRIDTLFLKETESKRLQQAVGQSIKDKNLCAFSKVIDERIREKDLLKDLHATTEFYTSVASCVETGLCSLKVSCDFLYLRMKAQRSTFCPFYDSWQTLWGQDISGRMDRFLIACQKLRDPKFDPSKQFLFACDEIIAMSKVSRDQAYQCD